MGGTAHRACEFCMKSSFALFLLLFCASPPHAQSQEKSPLVLLQTISLPKVQGGFNHMSVDAKGMRLFAAAPTNGTLEIADLRTGKPWRSLGGERPAAVRYAPEFNQIYVSGGQSLSIYNGETLNLVGSVDLESSLDELQYDPRAKRLYVGCMTAGKTGIAVIAIPEGKLVGKIPLPDKPQGFAVEQNGTRIFVNIPNLKQVAVIDREKEKLLSTWPLKDSGGNTPIGLDETRHRLFVGARHPAQLIVLDTSNGEAVAKIDTSGDADDLFYDPSHKRIYISCGEGFIDAIEQRDADHYRLLAQIPTVAGARTSTFSDQLNGFYVGVPRRGDQPAELRVFEVRR